MKDRIFELFIDALIDTVITMIVLSALIAIGIWKWKDRRRNNGNTDL